MTAPLPDAAPANWVDRLAPPSLRPWLKLGRFDRPTGIWLLMLPGWQGIALAASMQQRTLDVALLAKFFLGAALMRAAGCAYNDIVDRDIDAKVARTAGRPIPSGQISVNQAWGFVVACSFAALAILVTLPTLAVALGIASLALVAAYPFMKRVTWWPQAWLGLTFNWGALLGFAAVGLYGADWLAAGPAPLPGGSEITWEADRAAFALPALLLYASGVFWTLGYDTIYALQDLEDDALAGVKSSARRLGGHVRPAVAGFYAVAFALAVAAGLTAGLPLRYAGLACAFGVYLVAQVVRVRIDDPALALRLFKSNTWAGLMLFVAIAAAGYR
jgi:4-hydroxybenzoate polyprenyltransferase